MEKIPLARIIKIEDITSFKFHAARKSSETQPLDVYVRDKNEWYMWNKWRGYRNDFNRDYIFSLIDFYPETDMWLFGGIYKVLERNNIAGEHSYEISEELKYSPFIGRLKIHLPKPSRGRSFCLENHYDDMIVSEILKFPYSGEQFPGYENINHDFDILQQIFINEKKDWKGALESIKGIYLIMDKLNGRKYIGSAYGNSGIWSRWSCYMKTGHGYNDELREVINKKGFKYAVSNFRIALLEYHSMKVDDTKIFERESYWKRTLLSRGDFGYNRN